MEKNSEDDVFSRNEENSVQLNFRKRRATELSFTLSVFFPCSPKPGKKGHDASSLPPPPLVRRRRSSERPPCGLSVADRRGNSELCLVCFCCLRSCLHAAAAAPPFFSRRYPRRRPLVRRRRRRRRRRRPPRDRWLVRSRAEDGVSVVCGRGKARRLMVFFSFDGWGRGRMEKKAMHPSRSLVLFFCLCAPAPSLRSFLSRPSEESGRVESSSRPRGPVGRNEQKSRFESARARGGCRRNHRRLRRLASLCPLLLNLDLSTQLPTLFQQLHHQALPDALPHRRGPGRHQCCAGEHDRGRLALARLRHDQGQRLARGKSEDFSGFFFFFFSRLERGERAQNDAKAKRSEAKKLHCLSSFHPSKR